MRSAADEHLGLLGPTIRAEVGDEIRVVFSNRMRYPASVHSHGVLYNKSSEGSPYDDGTSGESMDLECYTYGFQVNNPRCPRIKQHCVAQICPLQSGNAV